MLFHYHQPLITCGEVARSCWYLVPTCGGCGRHTREDASKLPPLLTVKAYAKALVCSECGSREGVVKLQENAGARSAWHAERKVWATGP